MKSLTSIHIADKRGTSISISLYLNADMIPDYVKETGRMWNDELGGNSDVVLVNNTAYKPVKGTSQDAHTP